MSNCDSNSRSRGNEIILKPYRHPPKLPLVSKYVSDLKRNTRTQIDRRPYMMDFRNSKSRTGDSASSRSVVTLDLDGSYDFIKNPAVTATRVQQVRKVREQTMEIPDDLDTYFKQNSTRKPPLRPRGSRETEKHEEFDLDHEGRKVGDGGQRRGSVMLLNPKRIGERNTWNTPADSDRKRMRTKHQTDSPKMSASPSDLIADTNSDGNEMLMERRVPSH